MARQDRAMRTRQELIRSAAEAFDRGGFAHSSLAEISSRAGVSTGALHFHFSSKKELGEAVEAAAAHTLHRIIAHCPLGHDAPLQLLVDASHFLAQRLEEDVVLRAGFGLGNDLTWDAGVKLWLEWRNWVRGMLNFASGQGSLAADVSLEDAVGAITAAVVGIAVLARSDPEWPLRRSVTGFWQVMLPRLSAQQGLAALNAKGTGLEVWHADETAKLDLWWLDEGLAAVAPTPDADR
ncbi:ScbR family autoregulator-binding transcription factor [Streptomyces sp. MP131-18]|uniref:ScbR family autoregulator-binding transcription factor n=1 Tax=Streptomyces sp. MP131-18 TaxID=1857892 RepID=UPI00097C8CDF|nr:ScbR family autoregulator-binding transcription factor [Streptomyces sp. MP131-18]ONK09817.1 A-factor-binding protein [Streptomyces sp. MP131-18]